MCYCWMVVFGIVLAFLTNQIHKWSHCSESKANPIIAFLQSTRLIINHKEHHRHHTGKFDNAYCIINGWMNPFLEYVDFWRKAEAIITKITGAIPR